MLLGLQFYASVKSADPSVAAGNVLQLANTWEAFQLHDSIMAISVEVRRLKLIDPLDLCCCAQHKTLLLDCAQAPLHLYAAKPGFLGLDNPATCD